MGNNATKEARSSHPYQQSSGITTDDPSPTPRPLTATRRSANEGSGEGSQRRRGSRHDLSLFGLGHSHAPDPTDPTQRRETRAERDVRKLEKERAAREKERDRSTKEEGVDGGYLVTLGTYTGTEDFSKPVVRQLMIERRLAPFWKGLDDHEDSWTENQFVAAARGLPIPSAGQTPPEDSAARAASRSSPRGSNNHLTVPLKGQQSTAPNDALQNSFHGFTSASPPSPFGSPPSSSPFFRGRAKTLAALTTSRNNSQQDMTPQELRLPKDPYVQGHMMETFLYKNASECPICFLYYPPYLNKTRCCDQPICSECFVQIKRPDPHPPEHHDDPDNPHPPEDSGPPDEYHLVSEPATCPFCKQPELGITYDPPPFRRGLTYGNQHRLGASVMSAMSSSSSLNSQGHGNGTSSTRRRTTSLGANSPTVITTDKIRPDWAKKLSDARSHALRRAAAATALHNAAYVLGNNGGEHGPRFTIGRRRRNLFGNEGPSDGLGLGQAGQLLAAAERHGPTSIQTEGQGDLFPGRHSSRRSRMEDLEDLMMIEAIRLSLAAEEERKKKEDKENAKNAKKEEKQMAKDAKKAEKAAKKVGMYSAGNSSSMSQIAGSPEPASSSNGKGKAPDRGIGPQPGEIVPLAEVTSTLNPRNYTTPLKVDLEAQRHLEQSRAIIQPPTVTEPSQLAPLSPVAAVPSQEQPCHRHALRQLSNASSSASSFQESGAEGSSSCEPSPNSSGLRIDHPLMNDAPVSETPSGGGAGAESMFNFRSLAAVIDNEDKDQSGNMVTYIENASVQASPQSTSFPRSTLAPACTQGENSSGFGAGLRVSTPPNRPLSTGERLFGASSISPSSPHSHSPAPKQSESGVQLSDQGVDKSSDGGLPLTPQTSNPYDAKNYGDISILDSGPFPAGPQGAR